MITEVMSAWFLYSSRRAGVESQGSNVDAFVKLATCNIHKATLLNEARLYFPEALC